MQPEWEILVQTLRAELQAYGGLLRLFEEQQDNLLRGDADAVLSYAREIEAQVRATGGLREHREERVRRLAEAGGRPADSTLRELLPIFAEDVRPLISALIDEINHLIRRVRRGVRRNHELLGRAVQAHQEALVTLRPGSFNRTYAPDGKVSTAAFHGSWQAAG